MNLYPHPTTLPMLSEVVPLTTVPYDVSDSGIIRIASLGARDSWQLSLTHPALTQTQVDMLMGVWQENKWTTVGVVTANNGLMYYCPWVNAPKVKAISGAYYEVTQEFVGRLIPSVVPVGYGHFQPSPNFTVITGATTCQVQQQDGVYNCVRFAKTSTDGVASVISLSGGATVYNATITANRYWILIASVWMDVPRQITLRVRTSDATDTSALTTYTPPTASKWYRFARIINLQGQAQTTCQIRVMLQSNQANGEMVYLGRVSMLDITDWAAFITETAYPATYIPPEV